MKSDNTANFAKENFTMTQPISEISKDAGKIIDKKNPSNYKIKGIFLNLSFI